MTQPFACFWRIGVETEAFQASDLSGEGGLRSSGRWHRRGSPIIYSAGSIALACLETLVHLNSSGLPMKRWLVRIDVPLRLAERARRIDMDSAEPGWDAQPAGPVSLDRGDEWLRAVDSALLFVPSVIVPEEQNALINPAHPDARHIKALKVRRWRYDPRLAVR